MSQISKMNIADGFLQITLVHPDGTRELVSDGYNTITELGKKVYFASSVASSGLASMMRTGSFGVPFVMNAHQLSASSYAYYYPHFAPCLLLLNLTSEQKTQLSETSNVFDLLWNDTFTGLRDDIVVGYASPYFDTNQDSKCGLASDDTFGIDVSTSTGSSIIKYKWDAGYGTGSFNTVAICYYPFANSVGNRFQLNGTSVWKSLVHGVPAAADCYMFRPGVSFTDGTVVTADDEIIIADASDADYVKKPYKKLNLTTGVLSPVDSSLVDLELPCGLSAQIISNNKLWYFKEFDTASRNLYYLDLETRTEYKTNIDGYGSTLFMYNGYLYIRYNQFNSSRTTCDFYAYNPASVTVSGTNATVARVSSATLNTSSMNLSASPNPWCVSASELPTATPLADNIVYANIEIIPYGDSYMMLQGIIEPTAQFVCKQGGVVFTNPSNIDATRTGMIPCIPRCSSVYMIDSKPIIFSGTKNASYYLFPSSLSQRSNSTISNSATTTVSLYPTRGMCFSDVQGNLLQFKIEASDVVKGADVGLEVLYGVRTDV